MEYVHMCICEVTQRLLYNLWLTATTMYRCNTLCYQPHLLPRCNGVYITQTEHLLMGLQYNIECNTIELCIQFSVALWELRAGSALLVSVLPQDPWPLITPPMGRFCRSADSVGSPRFPQGLQVLFWPAESALDHQPLKKRFDGQDWRDFNVSIFQSCLGVMQQLVQELHNPMRSKSCCFLDFGPQINVLILGQWR